LVSEDQSARPILIGDADPAFRGFAGDALRRGGFEVIEADSGPAVLRLAESDSPALALVDVQLPGVSGYEVLRVLSDRYGDSLPTILVSRDRGETVDHVGGLLMGADDYLAKPCDPDELVARIRRSVRRTRSIFVNEPPGRGLTPREREILSLLAQGEAQGAIAARLVISPSTVATHIQHILVKLDVHSRAEAVAVAHREGLAAA
jgi:DNA-binding NarL/FixJ family response regulator